MRDVTAACPTFHNENLELCIGLAAQHCTYSVAGGINAVLGLGFGEERYNLAVRLNAAYRKLMAIYRKEMTKGG